LPAKPLPSAAISAGSHPLFELHNEPERKARRPQPLPETPQRPRPGAGRPQDV